MKKNLLTKVAKGIAYGDVSNLAVRNILTEISKSIGGRFTEQEMYDTLEFFEWKCPYTGKDLRVIIENDLGGYATDHIYPQNKEWCGLNVKGNLVIVDKTANAKKASQDVEEFLLKDTVVLENTSLQTRQERLKKIKEFQKQCGYDPEKIRAVVSPILEKKYNEVRSEQEQCISDTLIALEKINIHPVTIKNNVSETKKSMHALPELIFYPSDETVFKNELIKGKKANFLLTYSTGAIKKSEWKADHFDENSNLKANIQSRPFWRNKKKEGLIKVEVFIG